MKLAPVSLALSFLLLGCSSSESADDGNGNPDQSGQGSGSEGEPSGTSGAAEPGEDGLIDEQTPVFDLPAECARETYEGERTPVNLYLLLDASGSMVVPISLEQPYTLDSQSQWDAVRSAVVSFIEAPESSGLNLALNYFPLQGARSDCNQFGMCDAAQCITTICDIGYFVFGEAFPCSSNADCGYVLEDDGELFVETCVLPGRCSDSPFQLCIDDSRCADECVQASSGICPGTVDCAPQGYEAPAVDLSALPGGGAALVNSLLMREPDPFATTPTQIALQGAYTRVAEWTADAPDTKSLVVLATDGQPLGCAAGATVEEAIAQAQQATLDTIEQARAEGIDTFVIGVVPDVDGIPPEAQAEALPFVQELRAALDRMAESGGTEQAFTVSINDDAADAFVAALTAIRGQVLPCEYRIPELEQGGVDFDKLNVEFNGTTIPKVASPGSCDDAQDAWHYDVGDDASDPTSVVLCPSTCERAGSGETTRVDVVLGCQTVIVEAR